MRSIALEEAAIVLREAAPVVDPTRLRALPGATIRCWDEVIVERWLPSTTTRWDIMGAISGSGELVRTPEQLQALPLAQFWARSRAPASHLWFEWDVDRLGSEEPDPLCSICVADSVMGSTAERRVPTDSTSLRTLRRESLKACGHGAAEPVVELLVERLGRAGELLHIADLAPRGRVLRLAFFVRADCVISWLGRCGWPGPTEPLSGLLFGACAPFQRTAIQLEIDEHYELSSYIGIESREWYRPIPRPEIGLWREGFVSVGVDPGDELERLCAWAGTQQTIGSRREECVGFTFFKTAFDTDRWVVKAYVGVRPSG